MMSQPILKDIQAVCEGLHKIALEKLPAPEGMGRDATLSELVGQFEDAAHEIFGNAAEFLEKNIANADFVEYKRGDVNASWIFFQAGYESHKVMAHPTSESGTEDSRPYPDATVMRSRLQLLSFLITGNDYAFFSANPAIQESLKCYSERVIEDWQAKAESGRVEEQWIAVESKLPPRHQNVLCLNRDGNIFEGRICAGMHKPFFTYPRGDGNPSNTAPSWIDVTHWMSLPKVPASQSQPSGVRK